MPCKAANSLSATNLAIHHHLNCDLYLHYIYHGCEPIAEPVPPSEAATNAAPSVQLHSELTKAQFERGMEWERRLFKWLDDSDLLLTILPRRTDSQALQEIIDIDERDRFFIAGLGFEPPNKAFAMTFGNFDREPVKFGFAKPDLVEIQKQPDGTVLWRVIDAKSSKSMKTAHHVQIFFYHNCMQHILRAPKYKPLDNVAIWIPSERFEPPTFANIKTMKVSLLAEALRPYLFRTLPDIISKQRDQVPWHFSPRCRGCPFEEEDSERAKREKTLGSMPNITQDEAISLKQIIDISLGQAVSEGEGRVPVLTDIEELHRIFGEEPRLNWLEKEHGVSLRKAKRILRVPERRRGRGLHQSPALESALARTVQLIKRRNYTCPASEDIAIFISLLQDPLTNSIATFSITVFSKWDSFQPEAVTGTPSELIGSLAALIRSILAYGKPLPSCQFYTFSAQEASALQRFIIDSALTLDASATDADAAFESLQFCVGALCEGASVLALSFQPTILANALLDFLSKSDRKKIELVMCLQRMGLSTLGTVPQLKERLIAEQKRMQEQSGLIDNDISGERAQLGLLPRIVIVKREIERQLALPIPGYWDLPEACMVMAEGADCHSDEDIYEMFRKGQHDKLREALQERNRSVKVVLDNLRERVSPFHLLVNNARELSVNFMDLCQQEYLRKLFFMQQFEVLARLSELWRNRIDGCPNAPVLEYVGSAGPDSQHVFKLISGMVDTAGNADGRMYFDYLLVEDTDPFPSEADGAQDTSVPAEALFYDLSMCSYMIGTSPIAIRWWDMQHPDVRSKLLLANVGDVHASSETEFTLQIWPFDRDEIHKPERLQLVKGRQYRLSPRFFDFNFKKVLTTLWEIDLAHELAPVREKPLFLQLISNPRNFAQGRCSRTKDSEAVLALDQRLSSQLKQMYEDGTDASGMLLLKPSQQKATQRVLTRKLAVVWGPPGTGKTHTIAASTLRLIQINHERDLPPMNIFITAFTNAAIEACYKKLEKLIDCYRRLPDMDLEWLDNVQIAMVKRADAHRMSPEPSKTCIYLGTVFQLHRLSRKMPPSVDVVVIDEAGQLSLGTAVLVLQTLKLDGQVVMAGDSEQLAPILAAQYPQTDECLFGSVLDVVMHRTMSEAERTAPMFLSQVPQNSKKNRALGREGSGLTASQESTIVQLTENFRLNEDLGDFISTIYLHKFEPQKIQKEHIGQHLSNLLPVASTTPELVRSASTFLSYIGRAIRGQACGQLKRPKLNPTGRTAQPISLALLRIRATGSRLQQAGYEAHVRGEATLAAALVRAIRRACPNESIFVATPHRIQKQAVQRALATSTANHVRFEDTAAAEGTDDEDEDAVFHDTVDDDSLVQDLEDLQLGDDVSQRPAGDMIKHDTIERLQGSEASFVICLFSNTSNHGGLGGLSFLLERRRLNVAISRAQTLCIMISSDEVLKPPVALFADDQARKGYAFLHEYERHAWSMDLDLDLDPFLSH